MMLVFASSISIASTGDKSFTPTGFRFPVMKISIAKNTGSVGTAVSMTDEQVIYRCASTAESDCLVDLTNQTELDAISTAATGVSVDVGTYDLLNLYSCSDGKTGLDTVSVWLKGSFLEDSSSTTYYTNATSDNGLSSTSTTAAFTEITNWGCATKAIILASPIVVGTTATTTSTATGASPTPTPTASLTQTLTVLVDPTYLANSSSNNSPGMGGCKAPSGGGRGVCVNIPAVLPYVGTEETTTKRFLVAHSATSSIDDTKANAIVIVPMAGTVPLTAFAGPYFSSTSAAGNSNTSNSNYHSRPKTNLQHEPNQRLYISVLNLGNNTY